MLTYLPYLALTTSKYNYSNECTRKSAKLWSFEIEYQSYLIWVIFGSSPIVNVPDTCELYDPKLDLSTWAAWDKLRTFLLGEHPACI